MDVETELKVGGGIGFTVWLAATTTLIAWRTRCRHTKYSSEAWQSMDLLTDVLCGIASGVQLAWTVFPLHVPCFAYIYLTWGIGIGCIAPAIAFAALLRDTAVLRYTLFELTKHSARRPADHSSLSGACLDILKAAFVRIRHLALGVPLFVLDAVRWRRLARLRVYVVMATLFLTAATGAAVLFLTDQRPAGACRVADASIVLVASAVWVLVITAASVLHRVRVKTAVTSAVVQVATCDAAAPNASAPPLAHETEAPTSKRGFRRLVRSSRVTVPPAVAGGYTTSTVIGAVTGATIIVAVVAVVAHRPWLLLSATLVVYCMRAVLCVADISSLPRAPLIGGWDKRRPQLLVAHLPDMHHPGKTDTGSTAATSVRLGATSNGDTLVSTPVAATNDDVPAGDDTDAVAFSSDSGSDNEDAGKHDAGTSDLLSDTHLDMTRTLVLPPALELRALLAVIEHNAVIAAGGVDNKRDAVTAFTEGHVPHAAAANGAAESRRLPAAASNPLARTALVFMALLGRDGGYATPPNGKRPHPLSLVGSVYALYVLRADGVEPPTETAMQAAEDRATAWQTNVVGPFDAEDAFKRSGAALQMMFGSPIQYSAKTDPDAVGIIWDINTVSTAAARAGMRAAAAERAAAAADGGGPPVGPLASAWTRMPCVGCCGCGRGRRNKHGAATEHTRFSATAVFADEGEPSAAEDGAFASTPLGTASTTTRDDRDSDDEVRVVGDSGSDSDAAELHEL